ncbi:MAG: hypothetical protein LBR38_09660, partial [Synergistaceae bacterium]|nr:hypothetical protein [Synergistaceae bacterium]
TEETTWNELRSTNPADFDENGRHNYRTLASLSIPFSRDGEHSDDLTREKLEALIDICAVDSFTIKVVPINESMCQCSYSLTLLRDAVKFLK